MEHYQARLIQQQQQMQAEIVQLRLQLQQQQQRLAESPPPQAQSQPLQDESVQLKRKGADHATFFVCSDKKTRIDREAEVDVAQYEHR